MIGVHLFLLQQAVEIYAAFLITQSVSDWKAYKSMTLKAKVIKAVMAQTVTHALIILTGNYS